MVNVLAFYSTGRVRSTVGEADKFCVWKLDAKLKSKRKKRNVEALVTFTLAASTFSGEFYVW